MDRFIANLHKRPDHHKRRFALLVSSIVTLFIFSAWSLVNFGTTGEVTKQEKEVSPFESLRAAVGSSLEGMGKIFGEFKTGLQSVDLESEYKEMRSNTLEIYGPR